MRPVTLVKLGGSLLTDKQRPLALRRDVVARLAEELASVTTRPDAPAVILGHGSGSFGHWAAHRHRFRERTGAARTLAAARVQLAAGELHRLLIRALVLAKLPAMSLRPAAWLTLAGGAVATTSVDALTGALDAGAIPVVCGDVVSDGLLGTTIASTEQVFAALVDALPHAGWRVDRALWAGATPGILDRHGELVPLVDQQRRAELDHALAGAAGVDVTGGVRLRVDTALELARSGVESWIFDGTTPGALASALRREGRVGTLVPRA
jgi:isopentenyl phosphate kinase